MPDTDSHVANTLPKAAEAEGLHHYHTGQHLADSVARFVSVVKTFWDVICSLLPFSEDGQ
jgi:hypothetical protein